jgi:hypothetical protein
MQTPNGDNRNDYDHKVGSDIDHACAYQDRVLVHALLPLGNNRTFIDAFKSDSQDESNGIQAIPPEDEPDCPPDSSPPYTRRDEETLVE